MQKCLPTVFSKQINLDILDKIEVFKGTGASEKKLSKTYAKVSSNKFFQKNLMQIFLIPMLIEEYQIIFSTL